MIAYLTGSFTTKTPSHVYVDVNGVGYEVQISLNTYSQIQNLEKGMLYTHLLVREDAHILFGFFDETEKEKLIELKAALNEKSRPLISIKDNGTGIDPEALEKIFIPFFTTKKSGSGMRPTILKNYNLMQMNGRL